MLRVCFMQHDETLRVTCAAPEFIARRCGLQTTMHAGEAAIQQSELIRPAWRQKKSNFRKPQCGIEGQASLLKHTWELGSSSSRGRFSARQSNRAKTASTSWNLRVASSSFDASHVAAIATLCSNETAN